MKGRIMNISAVSNYSFKGSEVNTHAKEPRRPGESFDEYCDRRGITLDDDFDRVDTKHVGPSYAKKRATDNDEPIQKVPADIALASYSVKAHSVPKTGKYDGLTEAEKDEILDKLGITLDDDFDRVDTKHCGVSYAD